MCRPALYRALIGGVLATALSIDAIRALVIVTDAPAFSITITAGDDLKVDCMGGRVRVFDDQAPTTYTTACNLVTSITVTGGAADDSIDLSGVAAVAFSLLPSVTIHGQSGVDDIEGSALADDIFGDQGPDTIAGGDGEDNIFVDAIDDGDSVAGDGANDFFVLTRTNLDDTPVLTPSATGFTIEGNEAASVETLLVYLLGGNDTMVTVPIHGVVQNIIGGSQTTQDQVIVINGCPAGFAPISTSDVESTTFQQGSCTAADIDDNGVVDPLTDGLLFLRYTFGFTGATLVIGAVALDCDRCTAPEIEAFIQGLYP